MFDYSCARATASHFLIFYFYFRGSHREVDDTVDCRGRQAKSEHDECCFLEELRIAAKLDVS